MSLPKSDEWIVPLFINPNRTTKFMISGSAGIGKSKFGVVLLLQVLKSGNLGDQEISIVYYSCSNFTYEITLSPNDEITTRLVDCNSPDVLINLAEVTALWIVDTGSNQDVNITMQNAITIVILSSEINEKMNQRIQRWTKDCASSASGLYNPFIPSWNEKEAEDCYAAMYSENLEMGKVLKLRYQFFGGSACHLFCPHVDLKEELANHKALSVYCGLTQLTTQPKLAQQLPQEYAPYLQYHVECNDDIDDDANLTKYRLEFCSEFSQQVMFDANFKDNEQKLSQFLEASKGYNALSWIRASIIKSINPGGGKGWEGVMKQRIA